MALAKESTQEQIVRANGGKFPDGNLLYEDRREDWSARGMGGWSQLHDSTDGWIGSPQIQSWMHGGDLHMALVTKGTQAEPAVVGREKTCSVLNRLNYRAHIVDYEVEWGWTSINGSSYGPRAVQFGIDCAIPWTGSGHQNRHYGSLRWGSWTDEGGTWTKTNKIQVVGPSFTPFDLPGSPTYNAGFNESKGDVNYSRMRYNVVTGKYMGIIMGNQGYGCFAGADGAGSEPDYSGGNTTEQTVLMNLTTAPASELEPFSNGMNMAIDSLGRVESTRNAAVVHIFSTRLMKVA